MDPERFTLELRELGYERVVTVTRDPLGALDIHTHPFEARALVLSGDITLVCEGQERRYRTGDIFHLAQYQPHAERYGPQGVSYLVGRR